MRKRILTVILIAALMLQCAAVPVASTELPKFSFDLELYDAKSLPASGALPGSAQPLDPLHLTVGQEIAVAIRYTNLDAMNTAGIQCLAVSFCYDESCFQLSGFETGSGGTVSWMDTASGLSETWIPETLKNGYTASASDRNTEKEGSRRVYLQYIANDSRDSETVCNDLSAYVGAFYFTVKRSIARSEGVCFSWADFALALYAENDLTYLDASVANRNRDALLSDDRFHQPADIHVATDAKEGDSSIVL